MDVMNTHLALFVFLLLCASAASAEEQQPAWPVGEELVYRVKFSWMSAGISTMKVSRNDQVHGRDAVRLTMKTSSRGLVRAFARVDDVATSLIDSKTAQMLYYSYDHNDDGRRDFKELTAIPGAKTVAAHRKKHNGKEYRVEISRDGNPVVDTLSLFYYLRTVQIAIGTPITLTVYEDDKAYPVTLIPKDTEKVRVLGVGVFAAIRLKPSSPVPGLFPEGSDATIWVEKDTHTLLRMVVDLDVGSTALALSRVKNSPLLSAPGGPKNR